MLRSAEAPLGPHSCSVTLLLLLAIPALFASWSLESQFVSMGRKAGTLYINPKKFGTLSKPCMKEMISFLNCIALSQNNDEKCTRQKELLNSCMDAQSNRNRKPWGSINYHLQRLNRGRK